MFVGTKNSNGEWRSFRKIGNLSFAPEVDLTGQSLPVNELYVDIYTEEDIPISQDIYLYDEQNRLWAKYFIILAEHTTPEVVTVQAESRLARMDRVYVKAVMYDDTPVEQIIYDLFNRNIDLFDMDYSLASKTVTGYCPKQSKKERLQWICFAIGAYVKTFFSDKVEIKKIDNSLRGVPVERTFWRPSLSYRDYVKSVTVTTFAFTEKTEQEIGNEEYVKVGNKFYAITRGEATVTNDRADIPKGVAVQEIEFSDVYLVNDDNALDILGHLGQMYFKNEELEADIIDNGEFEPAHLVEVSIDPPDEGTGRTARGFIDSCNFSFGVQARASIHMTVQELREDTALVITYKHERGVVLARKRYHLPEGFAYEITNPYIDKTNGKVRKIYYPKREKATGTIHSGSNTNEQPYADALIYRGEKRELEVLSVDDVILVDQEKGTYGIE